MSMRDILFEYELTPTTWAYLSALLIVGTYFKFHRFWSVRNLDLVGLIFFSPGISLVFHGLIRHSPVLVHIGYTWLFVVGAFFTVRLFLDPLMVRRPLLEPNLNASGLAFTGAALLVFLVGSTIVNEQPLRLERVQMKEAANRWQSPGSTGFYYLASFPNTWEEIEEVPDIQHPLWRYPSLGAQIATARTVGIVALLMLTLGIVAVGFRHFDNIQTGVAAAALFLLTPYIGQFAGRIDHLAPGALLVWAVVAYRRPLIAGILMGLAGGLIFYPLFLLPLWCSFYWRRGLLRFSYGAAGALVLLVLLAASWSSDLAAFGFQLRQMLGGTLFHQPGASGFWSGYGPDHAIHLGYRVPVLAVFMVMAGSLGLWPAQKNLGTLLSCSATLMLATQFFHLNEGGLYMAWYLPLMVLTIFRPNLEDRVAVSAVIEGTSTWPARAVLRWRKRNRKAGEPE